MMEFFDYPTLRVVWWALLGVLLMGFALTDGFDLGASILLPFVAKTDAERRVVINTVGPVWEGNQVWLILGGGAIFAAWPALYALSFSGFYLAMFLILVGLILRPVGFKFRSKRPDAAWRARWDWSLFASGLVPALIFGVAMGNVLQGVPYHYDVNLRPYYTGNLLGLLNPFALVAGLVSVAMMAAHGGLFIAMKTEGLVQSRAKAYAQLGALSVFVIYPLLGVWLAAGLDGYLVSNLALDGPSNPLNKDVATVAGGLLANFETYPVLWAGPVAGIVGAGLVVLLTRASAFGSAFLANKVSIIGVIASVGFALFPVILPSSTHPAHSLTVFDSSSSHATLGIMLACTVFFLPLILMYTAWVYKVLWGKVTEEDINRNNHSLY